MRTLSPLLALACAGTLSFGLMAFTPPSAQAQATFDQRALEPLQGAPPAAKPTSQEPAKPAPHHKRPAHAAHPAPAHPAATPHAPGGTPAATPPDGSPQGTESHPATPGAAPGASPPPAAAPGATTAPAAPPAATAAPPAPAPNARSHAAPRQTAPASPPQASPPGQTQVRVPLAPPPAPVLPPPLVVPTRPPTPPAPAPVAQNAPGAAGKIQGGLRVTFGEGRADLNPGTDSALRTLAHDAPAETSFTVAAFAPGAPEDPSTPRRLSLSRALTVRSVLISAGIPSVRVYVKALGAGRGVEEGPADRVDVTLETPSPKARSPQ